MKFILYTLVFLSLSISALGGYRCEKYLPKIVQGESLLLKYKDFAASVESDPKKKLHETISILHKHLMLSKKGKSVNKDVVSVLALEVLQELSLLSEVKMSFFNMSFSQKKVIENFEFFSVLKQSIEGLNFNFTDLLSRERSFVITNSEMKKGIEIVYLREPGENN